MLSTSKLVLIGVSVALVAACAQPAKAPAPAPAPAPVVAAPAPAPAPAPVVAPAPAPAQVAWGNKPMVGRFSCELGRSVTVAAKDDNSIDLQWQGKAYAMTKVPTSSGAMRFEDKASGLVWIQIPAKSMLMDSKAGRQLANDCKN